MPFLIDPNEELDEDQLQVIDDLSVWGLLDVIHDRRPMVPVTVYVTQGDSTSSIAGLLRPSGEFSPKRSTRLGQIFIAGTLHDVRPAPFEATVTYEVVWDGATPSPEFTTLEGETRREHSHGILLGDYARRAAMRVGRVPTGEHKRKFMTPGGVQTAA